MLRLRLSSFEEGRIRACSADEGECRADHHRCTCRVWSDNVLVRVLEDAMLLERSSSHLRKPTSRRFYPIHYAAANGCTEVVAMLAAAGSPLLAAQGLTPLHLAALCGNMAEIAVLLESASESNSGILDAADTNGYVDPVPCTATLWTEWLGREVCLYWSAGVFGVGIVRQTSVY
jgi:ankyrin repeat protein